MATARDFRISLKAWMALTDQELDGFARQVSQEAAFRVVTRTPVDTGFLRGSWQPSIGAPKLATEAEAKQDPGKADETGAHAQAKVGIAILDMEAGDRFHMINNAEYAGHVHDGTASMAGRPWVLRVALSWVSICEKVAHDLGLTVK